MLLDFFALADISQTASGKRLLFFLQCLSGVVECTGAAIKEVWVNSAGTSSVALNVYGSRGVRCLSEMKGNQALCLSNVETTWKYILSLSNR
jgi:hypothetical protein